MPQVKAQSAGNGLFPWQGVQRRIGAFGCLPAGAARSRHLRCCVSCKGHAIPCETRLAANGFSPR
jgi:hypothetical protein